jgi:hypothetical protein
MELSEPLILGIGAGLFFSYMPFIRLHDMPVFSFRPLPGQIFSRVMRRLKIKVKERRFLNKDKSMKALDDLLAKGIPVGNIVGVFHLPYFPREYRFHFNAHNLCVIGKDENRTYTVSDPVSTVLNELSYDELKRVRFAKGTWPPFGKMYWVTSITNASTDIRSAIISGIKLNCRRMLDIPIPFFGVKGIAKLARSMTKWEEKYGSRKAALCLAQLIRMLEEIGTGGAGFRYMYAAFLQEAANILDKPLLRDCSKNMTSIGDLWREFAYEAARKFKQRGNDVLSYNQLSDMLMRIADEEKNFFTGLRKQI